MRTAACRVYRRDGEVEMANPLSAGVVAEIISGWAAHSGPVDAISFTGGEPLTQVDFLRAVVAELGQERPAILLETAGVHPNQLARIVESIDIVSMDLKPPSATGERPYWDEQREFLRTATRARDVYVKLVVDEATTADDLKRCVEVVKEGAPGTEVYVQPMMGEDRRPRLSGESLDRIFLTLRAEGCAVRVVPQIHKLLNIQ